MESHSSFCSPFTLAEFLAAASGLSSSAAAGPDGVAYPMLKHLPCSGVDFLLHVFGLSWSSHSFSSVWEASSIIPMHRMGKPLDSPASFRPVSLASYVSGLFERIVLSGLLFFLGFGSVLSLRQAGFRPGRFALDRVLCLSQSISDRFGRPGPGSRTVLSTIDFSRVFDSVWHPALFHGMISVGLHPCFARWTQSLFLMGALLWSIEVTGVVAFGPVGVIRGDPFLALCFSLSSSVVFRLLCLLPSAALCAGGLAVWSSPSVPTEVGATRGALFRLERWSEYWCLPLGPSGYGASFFSVDPRRASLRPGLLLLGFRLRFGPAPAFLGVTFDRTLSFSGHVSSLRTKFFPRLKALRYISASSWGPSKESLSVLYKSFLRSLLTCASPGWFTFLSAAGFTRLGRLHRAAGRAIAGCLSFSPSPLLFSEASLPPLRVTLAHFILLSCGRAFRLPASFSHLRFGQAGGGAGTLQIVLESFCVHSLAHASFFLFRGDSSCLPSLSSLESAFVHGGVHPFHYMLSL